MRLYIFSGDIGPGIFECLHHFGAKPCIMSLAVADQFQRQCTFIGGARQQDAYYVGNRQPHAFKHGRRAVLMLESIRVCTSAFVAMVVSCLESTM